CADDHGRNVARALRDFRHRSAGRTQEAPDLVPEELSSPWRQPEESARDEYNGDHQEDTLAVVHFEVDARAAPGRRKERREQDEAGSRVRESLQSDRAGRGAGIDA